MAELVEFKAYNQKEIAGILNRRLEYAFREDVWDAEALDAICVRTEQAADIRVGLYLLKEAGMIAEEKFVDKIRVEHVERAIKKLDEFTIKSPKELDTEAKLALEICRKNPGSRIGDVFRAYQDAGGKSVYRTFQRKVRYLAENKFITQEKITGGSEGTTTIIRPANTSLTEF